jgi:catechol 2,3-dioxygenase-like lactoylglutathione lyase family enzyme
MDLNQVTLPALDVAASVAFYRQMGFELIVDAPHYARFRATVGNATFSVHAVDTLPEGGHTVVYFECADLDRQVVALEAKGVRFAQAPRDEPWLWREARLVDPSGNVICLYHAGKNRLDPPWRVSSPRDE